MARNKTREEKIRSAYRLEGFRLAELTRRKEKDENEFAYLDAKYVAADLAKTVVVSIFMVVLIMLAKKYLG